MYFETVWNNGDLEMVQWLHKKNIKGCTTVAMDRAACHGHLDVVKFLHENRTEGCTEWAMDWAAGNGHLDVVKFLHENRTEGCTQYAMDHAAGNGHLDVVKWLHENRTEGCTKYAMTEAITMENINVVKWLFENRTEGCFPITSYSTFGMFNELQNLFFIIGGKLRSSRYGLASRYKKSFIINNKQQLSDRCLEMNRFLLDDFLPGGGHCDFRRHRNSFPHTPSFSKKHENDYRNYCENSYAHKISSIFYGRKPSNIYIDYFRTFS